MVTLYYRPGSCALAPHILLEWIGAPYEAINAPRDASYRAINASGAVPALKLADGQVITQAGAVLQHLAQSAGRGDLLGGPEPANQARVLQWSCFFTGDFHPAFFPLFVPGRYTTDPSVAAQAAVKAAAVELVKGHLATLDAHLSERTTFVGEQLTLVDAYAVPMLRWVGRVIEGASPPGLPWIASTPAWSRIPACRRPWPCTASSPSAPRGRPGCGSA
ncbi:glutathione S-transferase family protein [Cyanobium sp. ATX-6F1]|uniref:glutathione S-transferase family protein n=1 Tax=Cyanobium sp. ATX-6F1 TaxID=3137388 RepID=UPI0039BE1D2A